MYLSKEIKVGNLPLGGKHPIRIQSMTNTDTLNIEATVRQVKSIFDAGADMVRISTPTIETARKLENIKNLLIKSGYNQPLAADIHFQYKVAEVAAQFVEKIRINPGNFIPSSKNINYSDQTYSQELEKIKEKLFPLLQTCKTTNTVIRIGVNHGSLSQRIINRHGNTIEGMVISAIEYVRMCEEAEFTDLIISLKSSNTKHTVFSNRMFIKEMIQKGMNYPVHLGVTESGNGNEGRLKSAAGIGTLLKDGIGDTIRVSLTEAPEKEIPVAQSIVKQLSKHRFYFPKEHYCHLLTSSTNKKPFEVKYLKTKQYPLVLTEEKFKNSKSDIIYHKGKLKTGQTDITNIKNAPLLITYNNKELTLPTDNKGVPRIIKHESNEKNLENYLVSLSVDISTLLIDNKVDGILLNNKHFNAKELEEISFDLLQANETRYCKPVYVACPTCARTTYNVEAVLKEIKEKTKHIEGIKIAVMGCIVNGPGEMEDADYGYIGIGNSLVNLYKNKNLVKKNVPEEKAVNELLKLINR